MKLLQNKIVQRTLCSIFVIVLLWIGWLIAYRLIANDYILPSVGDTLAAAGELMVTSSFWKAFFQTLWRTVLSFLCSFLLAFVFALLSFTGTAVRAVLKPLMSIIRTLPTMAVILVLLIWTTPRIAPVAVTMLVSFPMLYSNFLNAFDNIDRGLSDMSKVYRVGTKTKLLKMYVPLTLPYLLGEIGTGLSFALKVMVSAEVLAKTYQSLGGMMNEAKMYVEMPQLLALTVIVVICGILLEGAGYGLKKLIVRWQ